MNGDIIETKIVNMNTTAAVLVLSLGITRWSYAGQPVPPPQSPPTPVQIARILESLPQGEARKGASAAAESPTLGTTDQEFVRKALAVVSTEARIGQVVAELGATEEVRSLGNELFVNQSLNEAALREAARLKNFEVETRTSSEQEALISSFRLKTPETIGAAFQEYVSNDRSGAIPTFAEGARAVADTDLRTLAERVLGELRTERPNAAAAIAAKSKKDPAKEVASKPARPKATAASRTTSAAKGAKAKTSASAATKPAQASSQTSLQPSVRQNVLPASPSTATRRSTVASPNGFEEPAPTRAKRSREGRIRMAPMISADPVAPQAIPSRRVFRQEVFRSSDQDSDD